MTKHLISYRSHLHLVIKITVHERFLKLILIVLSTSTHLSDPSSDAPHSNTHIGNFSFSKT